MQSLDVCGLEPATGKETGWYFGAGSIRAAKRSGRAVAVDDPSLTCVMLCLKLGDSACPPSPVALGVSIRYFIHLLILQIFLSTSCGAPSVLGGVSVSKTDQMLCPPRVLTAWTMMLGQRGSTVGHAEVRGGGVTLVRTELPVHRTGWLGRLRSSQISFGRRLPVVIVLHPGTLSLIL